MPRVRKRIVCLACHHVSWTMDEYRRHKAQAGHRDEGYAARRVREGDRPWPQLGQPPG